MKDRLLAAASIVMMLTCAVALAALWLTLKENREVNAALLAQLKAIASAPAGVPAGMATLKIKAVSEKTDGPPLSGANVTLHGHPFRAGDSEDITVQTGKDGTVTIGPILPGTYNLKIAGETCTGEEEITLFNGQAMDKTIICPPEFLHRQLNDVTLSVEWPDELSKALDLSRPPYKDGVCIFFVLKRVLDTKPWRMGEIVWNPELLSVITTPQGGSVNPERLNRTDNKNTALTTKEITRTIALPAGKFRLESVRLIRPDSHPLVNMDFSPAEQAVIEMSVSKDTLRLPIPDLFRQEILKTYALDKIFELTPGVFEHRFRDVLFKGSAIDSNLVMLNAHTITPEWGGNPTITKGEPFYLSFNPAYEFSIEQIDSSHGHFTARVRARYVPGAAVATPVPAASAPKVLYEAPTTHTQPALRR